MAQRLMFPALYSAPLTPKQEAQNSLARLLIKLGLRSQLYIYGAVYIPGVY